MPNALSSFFTHHMAMLSMLPVLNPLMWFYTDNAVCLQNTLETFYFHLGHWKINCLGTSYAIMFGIIWCLWNLEQCISNCQVLTTFNRHHVNKWHYSYYWCRIKKPKETKTIKQKTTEPIYILSTLLSILLILFASSPQPQLLFRKYPSLLWYVTKPAVKAAAYGLKSYEHWPFLVLLVFFRLPVLLNSHKFGELFWDTVTVQSTTPEFKWNFCDLEVEFSMYVSSTVEVRMKSSECPPSSSQCQQLGFTHGVAGSSSCWKYLSWGRSLY